MAYLPFNPETAFDLTKGPFVEQLPSVEQRNSVNQSLKLRHHVR